MNIKNKIEPTSSFKSTMYILLFALVFSTNLLSQGYGYMGKKHFISLQTSFHPQLANSFLPRLNAIEFWKESDPVHRSFKPGYGFAFRYEKQKNGFRSGGIDLIFSNSSYQIHRGYSDVIYTNAQDQTIQAKIKKIDPYRMNSFAVMGTVSFYNTSSRSAIGLINTLGFGITAAMVQGKHYDIELSDKSHISTYDNNSFQPTTTPLNAQQMEEVDQFLTAAHNHKSLTQFASYGLRFYWQTSYNYPISSKLILTVAAKANLNIGFPHIRYETYYILNSPGGSPNKSVSNDRIWEEFGFANFMNILEINTGIKIPL